MLQALNPASALGAHKINPHLKERTMNKTFFAILILFMAFLPCAYAQQAKMPKDAKTEGKTKSIALTKEKWHWGTANKQNESAGYAQVIKCGNTVYISGIPTSDLSAMGVRELYKSLAQCLAAFGATPGDVVKETLYTTDIEEMKKYNQERKNFYKGDFPAASWVQVSRLYEREAKLEVELIAVLGNAQ